MKKRDLIGKLVQNSAYGTGIIYGFAEKSYRDVAVINFQERTLREPYPECFFEGSGYTLIDKDLEKDLIAQHFSEWRNFKTEIGVLKNVRICCKRCRKEFQLSNYEKWRMKRIEQVSYCDECDRIIKAAERLERMRRKPTYSFGFVASLMWHSMPVSSKKSRIHDTFGMSIGW